MLLPLPRNLLFYYDAWPKSTGWLSPPTTLLGGLFLTALLALAWRLRNKVPMFSLGILWFFSAHLLTSNVFNLELVFEHRNYFALLGVVLAIADIVRRAPVRDGPSIKWAGVGMILLIFGFLCVLRAATWGNPLLLATDMVANTPLSARASNDLGEQYMNMSGMDTDSPFHAMAVQEFERGMHLPGSSPLPEQGLILMAAASGQPSKADWWDSLSSKLDKNPIGPQEKAALAGLVQQRYKGLKLDDARLGAALKIMVARTKMEPSGYAQIGDYALTYLQDETFATNMFVAAIDANPGDKEYAMRIFATLIADQHKSQADAVYQRAFTLGLMSDKPTAGK